MALLTEDEQQAIAAHLGYAYDGVPQLVTLRLQADISPIYLNRVAALLTRLEGNDAAPAEAIESSSVIETCKTKLRFTTTIALLQRQKVEAIAELQRLLGLDDAGGGHSLRYGVRHFVQYQ